MVMLDQVGRAVTHPNSDEMPTPRRWAPPTTAATASASAPSGRFVVETPCSPALDCMRRRDRRARSDAGQWHCDSALHSSPPRPVPTRSPTVRVEDEVPPVAIVLVLGAFVMRDLLGRCLSVGSPAAIRYPRADFRSAPIRVNVDRSPQDPRCPPIAAGHLSGPRRRYSEREPAAGHADGLAGDVTSVVGGEEHERWCDVGRLSGSTERGFRRRTTRPSPVAWSPESAGPHRTRRNGVHPDTRSPNC